MYLVEGDNAKLGIDAYNYLKNKYGQGDSEISEEIYVGSAKVRSIHYYEGSITLFINGFPFVADLFEDGMIR